MTSSQDGTTEVELGEPIVSDSCGPFPTITNNAPAVFPVGDTLVTWSATDASGNTSSGDQIVSVELSFAGKGQRSDVKIFLTYANPKQMTTLLPLDTSEFTVTILYSDSIDATTFSAELNGLEISGSFNPVKGTEESVTIQLNEGRNTLLITVEGVRLDGKTARDSDRLVFDVGK